MSLCIITPIKDSCPGPARDAAIDFATEYTFRTGKRLQRRSTWLSSHLARSRTVLTREALLTNCEHILFLDDDITFSPEDVFSLLNANEDFISGIYHHRKPNGDITGRPVENPEQKGSLLDMQFVGLGFSLIKRTALEKLINIYGEALFEFAFDGERVRGEDELFCERWRKLGGRIWLHTDVKLGHVGPCIFNGII